MKPCRCTPEVPNPTHRAYIETAGIGIYSPGTSIEDALANVEEHRKKDHIRKRDIVTQWVECLACGDEVRDGDCSCTRSKED